MPLNISTQLSGTAKVVQIEINMLQTLVKLEICFMSRAFVHHEI